MLTLILMAVSHFGMATEPAWETVEEVLAVVGSTPILLSDVELAKLVRLVDGKREESRVSMDTVLEPEDTVKVPERFF